LRREQIKKGMKQNGRNRDEGDIKSCEEQEGMKPKESKSKKKKIRGSVWIPQEIKRQENGKT